MKKIIFILMLVILSQNLSAQMAVKELNLNNCYYTAELESFKFQLKEELGKYFFVLQEDLPKIIDEAKMSAIRGMFKEQLKLQFLPAGYIISCNISIPNIKCKHYNINITATETESRKDFTISANSIPEESLKKAAELIALIFKNSIPAIYAITQVKNSKSIIINYGSERNAESGQKFEIYKFTNNNSIPIGKVKINDVWIQSSICKYYEYPEDEDVINNDNYKKYYVQTIIDNDLEKDYRKKLQNLFADCDDVPPTNFIEYASLSVNTFYYKDKVLSKYFNKETFEPFIFGLKWILIPGKNFGLYLNGKVSTYSSLNEIDNKYGDIISKFMFYQAGAGFNINLPISDIFISGLGVGVNFHEFKLVKEDFKNKQLSTENINGLDYELRAFASLRLSGYFGFHGEVSYHINPEFVGSENTKITTNALSVGVGISIFIQK
jgi:hypothetical protein